MYVSPMLLGQVSVPPENDVNWLSELKMDGIRLLHSTMDGVDLFTRHKNKVTERFPEIIDKSIPKGVILDGELIRVDEENKPDFEDLLSRFQVTDSRRIPILSKTRPVTFCAFDVIYYNGNKVSHLPLTERKELLSEIIPEDKPRLAKTLSVKGKGKALFDLVVKQNLEGIVLKRADSKYQIGKRSNSWLKVINYQYATVSIIGYRRDRFGWVLSFSDGSPAGILELVPIEARKSVYRLANMVPTRTTTNYIYFPNDSLKCKIKYRALTKSGLLRLPSFLEFAC